MGYIDTEVNNYYFVPIGRTYFFKDDVYWAFENQTPLDGYPRLVNGHFSLMLRCPCKVTF